MKTDREIHYDPNFTLQKGDVFGDVDAAYNRISEGMVVAHGNGTTPVTCPVWNDVLPFKTVTVICNSDQVEEVEHWLGYVHGLDCISKSKVLDDGRIAIRSQYTAW